MLGDGSDTSISILDRELNMDEQDGQDGQDEELTLAESAEKR